MRRSQHCDDLCPRIRLCSSDTRLDNIVAETIRLFALHVAQCFHHGVVPGSATERNEAGMGRKNYSDNGR